MAPKKAVKKAVAKAPAKRVEAKVEKKPAGATARNCPLVMDGEIDAAEFSPGDCLTCSEFDCRFCEAEAGSGALRSRLFAASEEGDADDGDWGGDFSAEEEDPEPEADDEGGEDELA